MDSYFQCSTCLVPLPNLLALGSMIGATMDVDMLTYKKKVVIQILVIVMNKEQLPLTTDVVFDKVGYDITFSIEGVAFEPALPPSVQPPPMDGYDDGTGNDGAAKNGELEQASKKERNSEKTSSSNSSPVTLEPTPMQTMIPGSS